MDQQEKFMTIIKQLTNAFTDIPFNQMLGLTLDEINESHVTMSFRMKPELIGNYLHGILHGGVISSVLDMAGGMVTMASAIHKKTDLATDELVKMISKTSTIDLQVSYLSPGRGEQFIAKAKSIKTGNKISFTRMKLFNQDQQLIATANGTYLLT